MSIASLFRHVDIDVPRYVAVNGTVVENVTDRAAGRTEALCSEAQRLLESLGILPPKPLPKRQWWWWIAAGALTAVAGVAVAAVRQPGRLFPMED